MFRVLLQRSSKAKGVMRGRMGFKKKSQFEIDLVRLVIVIMWGVRKKDSLKRIRKIMGDQNSTTLFFIFVVVWVHRHMR